MVYKKNLPETLEFYTSQKDKSSKIDVPFNFIGITTRGNIVNDINVEEITKYVGMIEDAGSDKPYNYFIKSTQGGLFYNPFSDRFASTTIWSWHKVTEAVMELYCKFLSSGSERYLLIAQRIYQNG